MSGRPDAPNAIAPPRWVDALLILWLGLVLLSPTPDLPRQGYLYGDGLHYAAIAKSTLQHGDLLALRLGDEPYFNKPPLLFWMLMASFSALGANTWTAQLVGIVFGLALLLGTWALGCRLFDRRHGLLAAVILCTTYVFLKNSSVPRMDAPLAAFTLLALGSVLLAERSRAWLPLFWVCAALGVVLKGAAGLLAVPVLLLWSALRRRWDPWKDPLFWSTLPLVPLGVLPWVRHNHELFGERFVAAYRSDVERIVEQQTAETAAIVKYVGDLFTEGWPWVPFVLYGLWLGGRALLAGERDDRWTLPCAMVLGVMGCLLTLSGAYSRYVLPLLPGSALLTAAAVLAVWPRFAGRAFRAVLAALLLAATATLAFTDIDVNGDRVPDVIEFRPAIARANGPGALYQLGDSVAWHLQAASIFYLDEEVRPLPVAEVPARLRPGATLAVLSRRDEHLSLPDEIAVEIAATGKQWTLMLLRRR